MNTQTAGVWVREYDNDTGENDESFREWWTVTNGQYSFDCNNENAADFLLSILSQPTLTIQQALEVWDDAREYNAGYMGSISSWENDKRTYFLNKFGIDIDKMRVMKEEIVNKIYAAYGSDSGILFGITDRNVVTAIVEFTLNRLPKNEQPEQNEWSDEQWINFVMWYSGMNRDSVMQGIRQYKTNQ